MNVMSWFDGMSCGRIALDRAGIKVDSYYAAEIDKPAQKVSAKNYPDNYTDGVSNSQRYKMLGNGWTVDVITHILKHIERINQ